jgi:sialic acid synthase SpsE
MNYIQIGDRKIGPKHPCFVIAEMSCNHRQNYDTAVKILHAAKAAGADAVKLQTYKPDTLTLKSDHPCFFIEQEDAPGSWQKKSFYELYEKAYMPWEWQAKLKKEAESIGIGLFSTPFDVTAVEFLQGIDVPCYKIASYELIHTPLLRAIAATGKPIIMSCGFATLEELERAMDTLRSNGAGEIAVLHCVTTYSDSADASAMRFSTMADIAKRFDCVVGFSDNNGGIEFPVQAVCAGASIIEKHFVDKRGGSLDDRFSLEPDEFTAMVKGIRRVEAAQNKIGSDTQFLDEVRSKTELAMGQPSYGTANSSEDQFRAYRPSIFVCESVNVGDTFTNTNLRIARPGAGLPPYQLDSILGKCASQAVKAGTPLSQDMIAAESPVTA